MLHSQHRAGLYHGRFPPLPLPPLPPQICIPHRCVVSAPHNQPAQGPVGGFVSGLYLPFSGYFVSPELSFSLNMPHSSHVELAVSPQTCADHPLLSWLREHRAVLQSTCSQRASQGVPPVPRGPPGLGTAADTPTELRRRLCRTRKLPPSLSSTRQEPSERGFTMLTQCSAPAVMYNRCSIHI